MLERKPGALRNGAPFAGISLPPELNIVRKQLESHPNGVRDFAHILSYIALESLESVVSACAQAIKTRTISKDVILNILLRKQEKINSEEGEEERDYPLLHLAPQVNLALYDYLLSEASL